MDLSIVVVNWNTRELLIKCLKSVYSGTDDVSYEVFVVDNSSSDGSAQAVRERFPQVLLIENTRNVGFAQANNQAIRRSSGRYVLLLNSDTEVRRDALRVLVDFLDAHPRAGAAGPRLLNPDGTLQPSCNPMPTVFREFWRLFHFDDLFPLATYAMNNWDLSTPREVDTIQGACLLLRREALNKVGLLNENFFMYSEEIELCYRLRRAGWALFWVPGGEVVHYGGQSTQQASAKMFLELYRSKYLFFQKTGRAIDAVLFKLILWAASGVRVVLSPLAYTMPQPLRDRFLTKASWYRQLITHLRRM